MTPPRDDVRDIFAVSALILQLSNKPESFGRTVIEALSLCRPVLGYAHGGVGELLAELYPAGRVPLGDRERLVERAAELLRLAPSIAPLGLHPGAMQSSVLRGRTGNWPAAAMHERLLRGLQPLWPLAAAVLAGLALLPVGRASELGTLLGLLGGLGCLAALAALAQLRSCAPARAAVCRLFRRGAGVAARRGGPGQSWVTVAGILRYVPLGLYVCWVLRQRRSPCALSAHGRRGGAVGARCLGADPDRLEPRRCRRALAHLRHLRCRQPEAGPGAGEPVTVLLLWPRGSAGAWRGVAAGHAAAGPVLLAGSRAAWLTYALVVLAFAWHEARTPAERAAWLAAGAAWRWRMARGLAVSPRFAAHAAQHAGPAATPSAALTGP